ncbi:MAG: phage portal protein, partial [Candidatus Bathyarchaeia archaeon]
VLWDYVYKGLLKVRGSGAGFVVPPYTAYWERLWGTTPIEDLPKYKDLYTFTPYIKAAIDVTVNLAVSNGFELEGGEDEAREWLTEWLDEQNILQTLRIVATDMLVFGNAYLEICRDENTGKVIWLKPLDPVHMRVRRDAYGNVFGYIQLLTFPPVVFEAKDIVHFKWGAKSWWYESAYGTSLLRPLLKIQALIDQLEDDMAIIVHTYAKPMLVVKAGTPERPFTDQQLRQLVEAFRDRKPATDVFVRGDVDVEVVPSLTKDVNITWWLDYLYTQREAVLGVPKIFMGKSEGTNRACYSKDTYVLTEDGWKLHPEVGDRKIAVYDPETDSIKFEKPIKLFAYDYQGEMYHFKSRSGVDILVTPEHKMLYKTYESPKWRINKAEELPKRVILKGAANFEDQKLVETFTLPSVEIKTAHNKVLKVECEKSIKMDDWLEFVGYFLSEGGLSVKWKGKPNYVLTLAQKDRKKAEKISDCLKRCGLSYTEYIDGNLIRWNVYGKQVWMWLKENCGAKHCEKHVPREFLNLPKKQLAILFNALMLGDGTRDRRPNRTNMTYYTTSKTLAEDVQVIALKLGYFAHISTSVDKRAKRKPVYRVLINNAKDKVVKEIKKVAYKGKVYCFQTSTGFYVTMRNGKPTIQGNTAEVVMQEYVTRLRMMQEIIGDQLETCLFKQLIKDEFGEGVEIPKVKWRPIWEPSIQDKAKYLGDLVDKGIILPKEARTQLGFPEEYPITTPEELQAILKRNGVKP